MRKLSRLVFLLTGAALLSACDGAKEQLGLTRSSPDEFAVVKRAPLEMPPEFSLRPPEPGAPRPQEQATADQARAAILGDAQASGTAQAKGEMALLQSADARFNPDIRQIVNEEATRTERKNEPVVKKLLNIGGDTIPAATIVDPEAEAARIQRNTAEGMPVTEGKTPTIED